MKRYLACLLAVILLAGCGGKAPQPGTDGDGTAAEGRGKPKQLTWSAQPEMKIDPDKSYTATIQTSMGDIQMELFAKEAPGTVNNFVFLAREGYYDNVLFHRVIEDFMLQTGDPLGTGTGGPGYTIPDEPPATRSYDPGIVAMARTQRPNSAGSQFFICTGAICKGLDQDPVYAQFGRVIAGMDVAHSISTVPKTRGADNAMSKPVQEVWIKTVLIEEK